MKINYFYLAVAIILLIPIIISLVNIHRNNYYQSQSSNIIKRKDDIILPEVKKSNIINKTIYQTYKNIDLVPNYYIEDIKKKNPDWKYEFYDDNRIREFLKDNFEPKFLEKFDSFKKGAHKVDLWRLCILYLYGGFYFDIDMLLYKDLNNIISECNNDFITAKTVEKSGFYKVDRLFNALIFCKAGDPLVKKCIINLMNVTQKDLDGNYLLILYVMQKTLGEDYKYEILEDYKWSLKIGILREFKKYYIYDKNKNIIGESKREDY